MIYITCDVHGDVDFEKLIQLRKEHVSNTGHIEAVAFLIIKLIIDYIKI